MSGQPEDTHCLPMPAHRQRYEMAGGVCTTGLRERGRRGSGDRSGATVSGSDTDDAQLLVSQVRRVCVIPADWQ